MKIKKNIPLIDQHNQNGFWGGKFGGSFIPETLKKPVEDLTILFKKLRADKKFLQERDYYFNNWVGAPTPFIKLENLLLYKKKNVLFIEGRIRNRFFIEGRIFIKSTRIRTPAFLFRSVAEPTNSLLIRHRFRSGSK